MPSLRSKAVLATLCAVFLLSVTHAQQVILQRTVDVSTVPAGGPRIGLSPDGQLVYLGFFYRNANKPEIDVMDSQTGRKLRSLPLSCQECSDDAFTISPDGTLLASDIDMSNPSVMPIISTADGHLVHQIDGSGEPAFSPDGTLLAVTPVFTLGIRIYETKTWRLIQTIKINDPSAALMNVSFSPDNRWLITGYRVPGTDIWDVKTGRRITFFRSNSRSTPALSPASDRIFAQTLDGKGIGIWDVRSGALIQTLQQGTSVSGFRLVDGGRRLVSFDNFDSLSQDVPPPANHLYLWDLKTFKLVKKLSNQGDYTKRIASSFNGNAFVKIGPAQWRKGFQYNQLQKLTVFKFP